MCLRCYCIFCFICVTSLKPYQIAIITAVEKDSIENSFMIYGSLHNVNPYVISSFGYTCMRSRLLDTICAYDKILIWAFVNYMVLTMSGWVFSDFANIDYIEIDQFGD